jgi:hypothetical protein
MENKDRIMLDAIMKRYGGFVVLRQAVYEDVDTVLVNLNHDVNDLISEDDFLSYIRRVLG